MIAVARCSEDFSPDQEVTPVAMQNDDDVDEFGKICSWDVFTAASIGETQFLKEQITRGSDVNVSNKSGWTLLMYAANAGHASTCKLLLECGAKVDAKTKRDQTSLMLAASCGKEQICKLLLQFEADFHLVDNRGWTALFYATHYNHTHVVKQLLQAGANPNQPRQSEEETPFLVACAEGNEQMVQTYLDFGADINYRTKSGYTAKKLAYVNNHEKVSELLDRHRQATSAKSQRQPLQKTNSNPNPSIVDGHAGFEKFLELHPNFFDQAEIAKRPTTLPSFDKDKTLTPHSSATPSPRPKTLQELLDQLQLSKYFTHFEQNDIDLALFLQMTDTDLKEIGIKLLGPRKKMTNTIARWHQHAPVFSADVMESAYANYHRAISDEYRRKNDELNAELTSTQEMVEKFKHEVQNAENKYSDLQVSGKLCITYVRECKKHSQAIVESLHKIHGETKIVEYNSSRIRAMCDQILLKFAESGLI